MDNLSLRSHPIFDVPEPAWTSYDHDSHLTLNDGHTNVMAMRGSDLIVAVGKELRITSVADMKAPSSSKGTYKVLHAPGVDFTVRGLFVSPEGKFLAVAGHHQLAVVVLPRPAYSRLTTNKVECRSSQVGRYLHAIAGAPRISKVSWHPWGRGDSCLLVLTSDGAFREYDVSSQVDEPLQTWNFINHKPHRRGFMADEGAQEAVSFCFGQGYADWGPLTVYTLMKNGDIYAISPFLPTNADIPARYLFALESFVRAKRGLATQRAAPRAPSPAAIIYDQQFKYVASILKQVPTLASGISNWNQSAHIRRPTNGLFATPPARQGPFLLQPPPAEFEESFSDACDILYIAYGCAGSDGNGTILGKLESNLSAEVAFREPLGVVLVAHSDGRVDIILDLEKVEGKWRDTKETDGDWIEEKSDSLPAFFVFETVDLGLLSAATSANSSLLSGNTSSLHLDRTSQSVVFVTHIFGVHCLDMGEWMDTLCSAMSRDKIAERRAGVTLVEAVRAAPGTDVTWIFDTFSPEERASAAIVGLVVLESPYLGHMLLALTDAHQLLPADISLFSSPLPDDDIGLHRSHSKAPSKHEPPYVSLLSHQPFKVPLLPTFANQPHRPVPRDPVNKFLSEESLRSLGRHADNTQSKIREVQEGMEKLRSRRRLQKQELVRQVEMLNTLMNKLYGLEQDGEAILQTRLKQANDTQRGLLEKADKTLRRYLDNHSATLSDVEIDWFEELAKMGQDVLGTGSGTSLRDRTEMVVERYKLLREEHPVEPQAQAPMRKPQLGSTQIKALLSVLETEHRLLKKAQSKITGISETVQRHPV